MNVWKKIRVKAEARAVITIEASLIMPLILASIIFVISLAFYQHDRCLLLKAGFAAALRGEREEEDNIAYDMMTETLEESLKKTTGIWELSRDIKISDETVKLTIEGDMKLSGGILRMVCGRDHARLSLTMAGERQKPSDYIRTLRKWGIGYCY